MLTGLAPEKRRVVCLRCDRHFVVDRAHDSLRIPTDTSRVFRRKVAGDSDGQLPPPYMLCAATTVISILQAA